MCVIILFNLSSGRQAAGDVDFTLVKFETLCNAIKATPLYQ